MDTTTSPLLSVKDLEVAFDTKGGVVHAVNGISYELREKEILGIVGESGCGKSVSCLAMLRLLPSPPARIAKGSVWFDGVNLLDRRQSLVGIRGRKAAMVFQDSMTSLNPVLTIGYQIQEAVRVNLDVSAAEARHRTVGSRRLEFPRQRAFGDYPHQFSGGCANG